MSIVRDNPYQTTYDLYGDPERLAEFRLFSLNRCEMTCKGCFYNRLKNDYGDYAKMYALAVDLHRHGYQLETLYLLPTEFFENDENYALFANPDVRNTLALFEYVGIAATLEAGYDPRFFEAVWAVSDRLKVELQVNLSLKRIFQPDYRALIRQEVLALKQAYGQRIVINLALNTGFKIAPAELQAVEELLSQLSEDGIVELNFTFLFNDKISPQRKRQMLRQAFDQVEHFKQYYSRQPSFVHQYNDRTFRRKPSFAFIGAPDRIYANPILPFDEYVFIESADYLLEEPTVAAFHELVARSDLRNLPHLDACGECAQLTYCMGKHYFAIADHYRLGCFQPHPENATIEADLARRRPSFSNVLFAE